MIKSGIHFHKQINYPSLGDRSCTLSWTKMSGKKFSLYLFTLAAHMLALAALLNASIAHAQKREVSLEWELVENASSYNLEITAKTKGPQEAPQSKPVLYKVIEPRWTGFLYSGNYEMRVQAIDKRRVPGEWSPKEEFSVQLLAVALKWPKDQAILPTQDKKTSTLVLKWLPVEGAKVYKLKVSKINSSKIGAGNSENSSPDIIDVFIEKNIEAPKTEFKVEVDVAQKYQWSVEAIGESEIHSETTRIQTFVVMGKKLDTPEIDPPSSQYVREIFWSQPEYTELYEYTLLKFNTEKRKWEPINNDQKYTEHSLSFQPDWKGGQYRLKVRSQATYRPSSEFHQISFNVVSGDRSPASEFQNTLRQSIDRTTGWFGIASYLITNIQYQSSNVDSNTNVQWPPSLAGTGRLGLGYLSPVSNWGFISIADYGGFSINSSVFNYGSIELNGIFRKSIWGTAEIRNQFGVYYKQLPELVCTNINASNCKVNRVDTGGPHYGFEYWMAISPKLGFQVNAHTYLSLLTVATPNGQPILPSASFQVGLMGSYRLSQKMTGLMGYAYRKDQQIYKSKSSTKGDNSVVLTGHYLNFFLEWSL